MDPKEEVVIPTKDELLTIGEEGGEEEVTEQVPEVSPEEERARSGGWVPKSEWKGDPNEWRSAKEFNERGEIFATMRDLRKDNKDVRQALQFLTKQQQMQYDKGYQQAIEELKAQKRAALTDGELVIADDIGERLEQVKKEQEAFRAATRPSTQPTEPTDTFKEWHSRNRWYFGAGEDNKDLTLFANAMGIDYRQSHPEGNEAEMLAYVERKVKSEFKHKFQKAPPSPNGGGREFSGKTPQSAGKYSEVKASMTEEDRSIMKTVLRDTGMTEAEYFKLYS